MTLPATLLAWLPALAATVALEAPIWWWARRHASRRVDAVHVITPSLLTHPVVWFVSPWVVVALDACRPDPLACYPAQIVAAELFAIGAEAAWWRSRSNDGWRRVLAVSFVANLTSVLAGYALRALGAPL